MGVSLVRKSPESGNVSTSPRSLVGWKTPGATRTGFQGLTPFHFELTVELYSHFFYVSFVTKSLTGRDPH